MKTGLQGYHLHGVTVPWMVPRCSNSAFSRPGHFGWLSGLGSEDIRKTYRKQHAGISLSSEERFKEWKSATGPALKLQSQLAFDRHSLELDLQVFLESLLLPLSPSTATGCRAETRRSRLQLLRFRK